MAIFASAAEPATILRSSSNGIRSVPSSMPAALAWPEK